MPKVTATKRKIKWVGDPAILLDDSYTVADWDWENNRVVAVVKYARRVCDPDAFVGLSRSYTFGGPEAKDFVIEMDEIDADIILRGSVWEFVDVTDEEDPDLVVNEPIIVRSQKDGRSLFDF